MEGKKQSINNIMVIRSLWITKHIVPHLNVCATSALTTTGERKKSARRFWFIVELGQCDNSIKIFLFAFRLFIDCSSMSDTTRNYLAAKSPTSRCAWEKTQKIPLGFMKISLSPWLKLCRVAFGPLLVATHQPRISISTNCLDMSYTTGRQIWAVRHIHWHYSFEHEKLIGISDVGAAA